METHRATEIAYKNGYEKGKAEAEAKIKELTEENDRLIEEVMHWRYEAKRTKELLEGG